jgi:hypothetical protein
MREPAGATDRGCAEARFRPASNTPGSRVCDHHLRWGLLAYRELDHVLALTTTGDEILADARTGKNGGKQLVVLLQQSVLDGYQATKT